MDHSTGSCLDRVSSCCIRDSRCRSSWENVARLMSMEVEELRTGCLEALGCGEAAISLLGKQAQMSSRHEEESRAWDLEGAAW